MTLSPETCVFAFLGLSIFSFPHKFELSFVVWCIILVLLGRAVNIFPLTFLLNFFRDHKITPKMTFVMWFSGLRGAIPYALSLHLNLEPIEKRQLIGTTTIIIVLFTILLMGGGTMPLIRLMDIEESQSRRKSKKDINLSKTQKMVRTHTHTQTHSQRNTHRHTHAYTRIHTHTHAYTHIHTHIHTHIYTHTHIRIHTHTHAHTHTYTHIHTHTHI
ncbi:Sodium/hydrogen exchanger 8 [Liparis tanakae]|uniref:Sodium/hydrogen exchanger 8 n=1 Tax=Liparis tanakae TaxID=230148 RepID=A0A4Z2EG64_9TELE|nr:Sodium/hydrogen exchanger 8 [Liparis tanakae]